MLIERLVRHAAAQTILRWRLGALFSGPDVASAPIDWSRWNEVRFFEEPTHRSFDGLKAKAVPAEFVLRERVKAPVDGEAVQHIRSTYAVTFAIVSRTNYEFRNRPERVDGAYHTG